MLLTREENRKPPSYPCRAIVEDNAVALDADSYLPICYTNACDCFILVAGHHEAGGHPAQPAALAPTTAVPLMR